MFQAHFFNLETPVGIGGKRFVCRSPDTLRLLLQRHALLSDGEMVLHLFNAF